MGIRKEVRLEEIAEKLDVSVVTVSNALKGRKGVSEKLRAKIEKTAEELGYEVVGRRNYEERVKRIGIVVAERYVVEFQSFYMEIYRNIVKAADSRQCLTTLEVVDEKKEKLQDKRNSFLEFDIDGIVIIGKLDGNYIDWLSKNCKVPFVCADFYNMDKVLDYFVVDGYSGTYLLTEELIKLGHRDITFVGTPRANNSIMDRYMGYLKAITKYNIEESSKVVLDRPDDHYEGELDFDLPKHMPTAFVCNCDIVALILIEKLKKVGISVPEDISVVGFDNYCYKKVEGVQLTTYEYDVRALAQTCVSTLIKRIEKNNDPKGLQFVKGKIIEGNTVKDIRGKNGKNG